jgi:hypothetical protein
MFAHIVQKVRLRMLTIVIACASASIVLLVARAACASQGPGIAPGTAGPMTQLAMAILIYGASAVVVAVGLIGALRQH